MRRQPHARQVRLTPPPLEESSLAADLLGLAALVLLFVLVFVVGAVMWANP